MLRLLILRLATTLATRALADGHGGKLPSGVGAFVNLMVQAIDPDALIELMKKTLFYLRLSVLQSRASELHRRAHHAFW